MNALLEKLGIAWPILQAPMAGISTPELAAAISNAGGLGSIGIGAADAEGARRMIHATRALTSRSLHVNVFCNQPAITDAAREVAWLAHLAPIFASFGAAPPAALREIYLSFDVDDAKLAVLLEEKPRVVSFHFGLPSAERITKLRAAGIVLLASATSVDEALVLARAGIDAVIAQGYEAGGHRGTFDPAAPDDRLGTLALTRLLVAALDVPVIAAGGIMDGAGIQAVLALGASAAQLGTAFIACPESSADAAYRAALLGPAAAHTTMTKAVSGRYARCLANDFTRLGEELAHVAVPDYPIAYDAGKALNAAAKAAGRTGFGAQWAGQGAPLSRSLPAATLFAELLAELSRPL
jgi:nitronate monooxygenase